MTSIELLFFILLFIVFYTYLGYGLILYIIIKIKRLITNSRQCKHNNAYLPHVTLFIAAFNEEKVIKSKMKNCMALDYPKDKLKILWVTDGSNDNTNKILKEYEDVTVIYKPEREGKTTAINRGMKYVNTPITIFTDANTNLNTEAIKEIVSQFNDERTGCVAGEKRIADKNDGNTAASGEGIYWKYESTLKKWDSELYSTVGAAGELYGIRTDLFEAMPKDTLLDDFILSMRIAMKGYKIAYCDKAYAIEGGSANIKEEEKRKTRIAAGGIQSIYRLKGLLNILKYRTLSFQYISHRVLRWSITPISMLALIPINAYLAITEKNIYIALFILQSLFYISGFAGWYLSAKSIKNKYLYVPFYFMFMNISVIKGIFYLLKKKRYDGTWEKSERA